MSGTSNETNNASNENETNVQIEPKEEQNSMETEEESLPVLSEEMQEMSNFQKIEVQSVTEDNTVCEIEETTESEDLDIGDPSTRITTDSDGLDSSNITQSETDFSELIDTTRSLLENVAKEAESSVSDSKRDSLENIDPECETAKEVIPQEITGIEESDELVTVSEANLNNDSRNLNEGKDTYMEDLQDKPSEEYTVNDNKIADLESIPDNKGVGNDSQDDSHREISDEMILDSESMIDSLQEVDEASQSTSHRNGADFIHVNMDMVQNCSPVYKDGSSSMDKDEESGELGVQQDPIGDQDIVNDSDIIIDAENAREHGADEELCIIPDTERVISQAEKDAASAVPKLRDITEDTSKESRTDGSTSIEKKNVFRNEGDNEVHTCENCVLEQIAKFKYSKDGSTKYICSDECLNSLKTLYPNEIIISGEGEIRVKDMASCMEQQKMTSVGQCATCCKETDDSEDNLTWEFMDFCNQSCLLKHQQAIGSKCSNCSTDVPPNSLGKYAVRFGNDIRQFCTSHCLEEYKKRLKLCSYCQQDMSGGSKGFLSPAVEKGQLKDFCSQICMEKYDIMTNNIPPKVDASIKCCVCAKDDKPIAIDFSYRDQSNYFCGEHCFVAFSFVNKISAGKCAMCKRNFTRHQLENFTMFHNNVQYSFCSNSCQNIFIVAHRKIAPCSWCKVKKFNFDMIRTYSQPEDGLHVCSVNCLSLYQASVNTPTSKKVCCDFCLKQSHLTYRLIMSDATIRKFCSYSCCTTFKGQLPETPVSVTADGSAIVPIGAPRKSKNLSHSDRSEEDLCVVPILSSIQNLSNTNGNAVSTRSTRTKSINQAIAKNISVLTNGIDSAKNIQEVKQQIIVKPCPIPQQRNVATLTKVRTVCKNTNTKKIDMVDKEVQTDKREKDKILIPVPVPISVPVPLHMYTTPVVYPVPFPLPIPIPIFIPTTRNSANGIMKEIKKIQVKIPSDPYEAELLMMAEMVAGDKKEENSDSESDMDESGADNDVRFTPEPVDSTNTFGDDMLQMALKMATELEEPAVDLEGALTANTITATAPQESQEQSTATTEQTHLIERQPIRGRKRGISRGGRAQGGPSKRGRKVEGHELLLLQSQQKPPEPVEKPDVNMCLKYTFGVNAWKQWVTTKNSELEKSSRRLKLFKTELLQLSADELNYSLCLFVKEVRKPNGAEYAPDTIYYLCLGIQRYLFENGRIDNIFCHPYYEKFTDCLDEVARKFSVLYNDSQYIVTRVEEEHLWESKQLGAHSPHVLLSTLMFFNTKDFNLTTVDEHMQLSFSHIMKHWKRNPNHPGASRAPGSRNVLLRFYPPQSSLQNNTRKKKVYEQQENEESPLRCPVKLYEFYLSKCPESVKTRNDVFYLQPERSCVPDSPVWYSTMPLPRESLEKMLHRVKMVKEINVALLTT